MAPGLLVMKTRMRNPGFHLKVLTSNCAPHTELFPLELQKLFPLSAIAPPQHSSRLSLLSLGLTKDGRNIRQLVHFGPAWSKANGNQGRFTSSDFAASPKQNSESFTKLRLATCELWERAESQDVN